MACSGTYKTFIEDLKGPGKLVYSRKFSVLRLSISEARCTSESMHTSTKKLLCDLEKDHQP